MNNVSKLIHFIEMGFVDHLMLNPFLKQSHVCVCLRDCLRFSILQ